MVISSRANPVLRYVRSLHRRRTRQVERAFIVEGERAVSDAITAGAVPRHVVCANDWLPHLDHLREQLEPVLAHLILRVEPRLFVELADTMNPSGILAVFDVPRPPEPAGTPLLVMADGIRDPGNLGTLIRSAAGAGASGVVLTPGTVDPFNPKVVRAAMGAHFHLPILLWETDADRRRTMAISTRVLAEGRDHPAPELLDWTAPSLLIIGSEADGPGVESSSLATHRVSIPLVAAIESLNAAVAASVILFEASRQRRNLRNTAPSGGFHQSPY